MLVHGQIWQHADSSCNLGTARRGHSVWSKTSQTKLQCKATFQSQLKITLPREALHLEPVAIICCDSVLLVRIAGRPDDLAGCPGVGQGVHVVEAVGGAQAGAMMARAGSFGAAVAHVILQ